MSRRASTSSTRRRSGRRARIGMLRIGGSGARAAAVVAPRSALLAAVAPRRLSSAALQAHHSFYIDGKWVPPVQGVVPHQVINPATEQPIATIALGSPADVDAAVGAAQRALPSWSVTSREQRLAMLERLAAIYEARQGELARAISSEMGAPIRLATRAQAAAGLAHLRQFVRVLRGFEFEQPLRVDRPAEVLAHVPIGVCALIAPWNWPMNQVCLKVAPALAAGCTAVLKPSEVAPLSSLLFAEMIHEAGFPPGTFNLVQGEGAIVGEALAAHPAPDGVRGAVPQRGAGGCARIGPARAQRSNASARMQRAGQTTTARARQPPPAPRIDMPTNGPTTKQAKRRTRARPAQPVRHSREHGRPILHPALSRARVLEARPESRLSHSLPLSGEIL